jgi:FKBP-type peptidyl-prolyl cis-trans isomerase 2
MQSWKNLSIILLAGALVLAGCLDTPSDPDAQTATTSPGAAVSMPLILEDAPWDPQNVQIDIQAAAGITGAVTPLHATGNDTLAGWITFEIPSDVEEDDYTATVNVDGETGLRQYEYRLTVEQPSDPIEQGQQATIHVTGRTADGQLVLTTQQEIDDGPLPRSSSYQSPMQTEPIPIPVAHTGQLPEQLVDAILNAGVGHTLSVAVEEFFGPTHFEEEHPRQEAIPRQDQQQRSYEIPREQAEQQGIIGPDAQEGDSLDLPGLPLPYIIDSFTESDEQGEIVKITADVEPGYTFTLHEPWPEATEVTRIEDGFVHLYTTPADQDGGFTWMEQWPDASTIAAMDEDTITLRHSPEEGHSYMEPTGHGDEAEVTVVEVTEQEIRLSRTNPDPLAGETIHLEVHIVEVAAAQEAPAGPGPQGPPPQG